MEDTTFTLVSMFAALGGAIGTAVGYRTLLKERQDAKERLQAEVKRTENALEVHPSTSSEQMLVKGVDFARTIGYLGYYSLYGMIVYPMMPLYAIPRIIRQDAKVSLDKLLFWDRRRA